ncbi:MAG TPA: adenylate/guanylate cyclase domain-containing protein [Syntrophales bacterium]|nr:adenylate/guanylate cyclase domain-containing protein [Syntrophales bacterium]
MTINFRVFADCFSCFSGVSPWVFEIWEREGRVFSSCNEKTMPDFSDRIGALSLRVIEQAGFQYEVTEEGISLYGVPLPDEAEVPLALVGYCRDDLRISEESERREDLRRVEDFLVSLQRLLVERTQSQRESEKMAEELIQQMEDLHLYSHISAQVKALAFSGSMLRKLVREILEIMRSDISFAILPDQKEYNAFLVNEKSLPLSINPEIFINSLIRVIPKESSSLREDYFIVNDSRQNPVYEKLFNDSFRFLAVRIASSETSFGWLGLVSFNLREIFRQSELKLLKSVASSMGIALDNSRLYAKSQEMAKKERFIRNIFQKYVPAEVVNEILKLGERDAIPLGEKRLLTLLNADIRGYSRMSKTLPAEDVVSILNHFFLAMGNAILGHGGILDKYLGDGFLAIFGAPAARENPALDATLAAIDMLKDLAPVDNFARQRYGITLNIGISIHTGEAVVGNIGFDRKMEYTVIGDVVNDTFRLQDIAREKPNSILISKATQREVGRFVRTRFLGVRSLGAQESEMEVYEVLGTQLLPPSQGEG